MTTVVVVVDRPEDFPLDVPEARVVAAGDYLGGSADLPPRGVFVVNLCRSNAYQRMGWYVSLLGEARGHRVLPDVGHLMDLDHRLVRNVTEELEELVARTLADRDGDQLELPVWFGRTPEAGCDRLARALFDLLRVPLLRVRFERRREGWALRGATPLGLSEIPDEHRAGASDAARSWLSRRRHNRARPRPRYWMAVLHDPAEASPPSDARALARFRRAAEKLGIGVELIRRNDLEHVAEYDALFIRETTAVNHHTYRFARRAEAEGLVVVDDPTSILRCTNKVYLAELLARHGVPHPRTRLVSKRDVAAVVADVGLPCVLKQPDSAFSLGVSKAETEAELDEGLARLLKGSELVVAQEFLPTTFDWRVGIFGGEVLYVCRYHMARHHWQIIKHDARGERYGRVDAVPLDEAPPDVVGTARRAAGLIGDGLYGVDLKQLPDGRCVVIEVNDNPNIESGYEDRLLGDELYRRIMAGFLERLEARHPNPADPGVPPRGP